MSGGRRVGTVLLVVAAAIASVTYAVASATSSDGGDYSPPEVRNTPTVSGSLRDVPAGGKLVVRGVDSRASRADGVLYELTPDGGARPAGRLSCKRVTVSAAGNGLCFRVADDGATYEAVVFDERYRRVGRFPITGIPDRARLSPSGRLGTYTSFDPAGSETYFETPADFSTDTRIIDARSGKELVRLEEVEVNRGGKRLDTTKGDLWGVTFIDDKTYYATVGVAGDHYLIRGGVHTGRARVMRERVECPALSPDGHRIAYKRRIGDSNRWRLHVLDLRDGSDVALAETRSIDDQPEWVGDETIAYSDDWATFLVPADGSGTPHRIARNATSPDFVQR